VWSTKVSAPVVLPAFGQPDTARFRTARRPPWGAAPTPGGGVEETAALCGCRTRGGSALIERVAVYTFWKRSRLQSPGRVLEDEDAKTIDELWGSYKATGERDARDKLIVHYSPLVKYVAGRVSVGLPQNIEQADLVSYGVFGLIDAIDKF